MEQKLPFLFQTIFKFKGQEEYTTREVPNISPPDENSLDFSSYEYPITDVPYVLFEIFQKHKDKPIYLAAPKKVLPQVQTLTPYFHKIIPQDLINSDSTCSWISLDMVINKANPDQNYLLNHILYHFMSLLRFTNIYSEQTTRSLLWNKVLEYLTPEMIYNNNHIPFIAQLKKKNSTFFANSLRPSEILIYESPDSDSPEHYSFTDNCKISSKGITLESQSGEISEFATKDVKLWSSYLSNISSDIPLSPQLICYSFNSVPIEQPICEPFVESYEQMLLTHDLNFSIPLFDCILESENSKSLTDKLFKLYLRHGQRLRLFKEFAYYEIIYFASTPNEIYRQNNAFTQTIITFFKSELTEFINNAINPVKEEIVRHPLFDFDHPKEEDLPQIEELLNYFWVKTNESLQYIPLVIRRFLKYLRILCETHFGDINLNHKAVIGLFFLRFIVPSFNAPEAWIVNGQIDQTSFRKSVAFSKVILSVSTLETNYTKVGDRQILTPIIERNIPKMVHFLERITFVNDSEEMSGETENVNLPFDEVVEAIQEFRAFIKECSDKLLQKVKKNGFVAPLFVFEAVNALYQNDLYTKSRSYD